MPGRQTLGVAETGTCRSWTVQRLGRVESWPNICLAGLSLGGAEEILDRTQQAPDRGDTRPDKAWSGRACSAESLFRAGQSLGFACQRLRRAGQSSIGQGKACASQSRDCAVACSACAGNGRDGQCLGWADYGSAQPGPLRTWAGTSQGSIRVDTGLGRIFELQSLCRAEPNPDTGAGKCWDCQILYRSEPGSAEESLGRQEESLPRAVQSMGWE
jgi:hypothetical protein